MRTSKGYSTKRVGSPEILTGSRCRRSGAGSIGRRWVSGAFIIVLAAVCVACGGGDEPPTDGGPLVDAGPVVDAAPGDAGPPDAGPSDAGPSDAGPSDAGPSDAGPMDAGNATPTWEGGVADLFARECVSCHGWASNYSRVVERITSGALRGVAESRHYMTDDEAATVLAWIDGGYPQR